MTPETIIGFGAAVSAAITGIFYSISGIRRTSAATIREDLTLCASQREDLQRQVLGCLSHIFTLEQNLVSAGLKVPAKPRSVLPASSAAPRNGGMHRADAG